MEITKLNICEYLKTQCDLFSNDELMVVEDLTGDDSDTDIEGFINFIFRVKQGDCSYIVKQGRSYLRRPGIVDYLPEDRNRYEYLSFILREGIDKDYVPKMYFIDTVNHVFMMEDLSELKILRFQMNIGKKFPNFAKQISTFLAKNHFYTSELYLDKKVFRDLQGKFMNLSMREIMEDLVMMKTSRKADESDAMAVFVSGIGEDMWADQEIRLAVMKVRDNFIKKVECLIHGDLHTSNIFVANERMAVIDMEYSFIGPFSYDLGYLFANIISQYAAHSFKQTDDADKAEQYQAYLLQTICDISENYFEAFQTYFERDAKLHYRETHGFVQELKHTVFQEALGVMSVANMLRIINTVPFPDFDCITNAQNQLLAKGLALEIDRYFLLNAHSMSDMPMAISAIVDLQKSYIKKIHSLS